MNINKFWSTKPFWLHIQELSVSVLTLNPLLSLVFNPCLTLIILNQKLLRKIWQICKVMFKNM